MSNNTRSRAEAYASCSLLALGLILALGGPALAAETATAAANSKVEREVDAVVVTASKNQAAQVAPVSSSLSATEPQAVITRKFIEESAPRVGDFTTTAILAPSMATTGNANGPGATDGSKITLRGFQDGEFNITYDGIAWGDTNGPSHHANSFFPSSTIGGIVIDRGPGHAYDTGQANFGGEINLFSLPFEDHLTARQTATIGSFHTYQAVTTVGTGPVDRLHGANFVFNAMEYSTKGYLSNSPSAGNNQFFKAIVPLTDRFSVTALYTHNFDDYNQSDSVTPGTVAQTEAFGKRFGLGNDPRLATYKNYNYTKKETEFGYVRANAELADGVKLENTLYTDWYSNKTLSALNGGSDTTVSATALAAASLVTLTQGAYPAGGSGYPSTAKVAGIPGYLKFNWYRTWGDQVKATKDFGFGTLTLGGLYEFVKTNRHRYDIDLLTRQPDYREKAALFPGPTGCSNQLKYGVQVAPGKTYNGACQAPLNLAYLEYSGWRQYQLSSEFEWRPTDKLTITPGLKYLHFQLYVHAPVLAISGSLQPSYTENTYTKTLPYLSANYRIRPTWSVYAQYAQGFLVPDISSLYVNNPLQQKVVPQQSTNYQLGTVFSAGKLTFDGDVYYIDFKHKIQTLTDLTTNETYETNLGGATYKGIEVQATYALLRQLSVFAKDDPLNPGYNGRQLTKAPFWTAGLGVRVEHHELFSPDDSLVATLNDKFIGPQFINAASGTKPPNGKLHEWSEANLSLTYRIGRFSLEGQALNLFDHTDPTNLKGKALIAGTNLPAATVAQGGGANIFTYQTGRSYQLTAKVVF
jgi:iron complex outermembrane receptor protein